MNYFAQVVHKLWMTGGILMHTIHKPVYDMEFCRPQPVDCGFFTPIFDDLTTQISGGFNSVHIFCTRFPQVFHKLWVNYIHVIPQRFGMISGMSSWWSLSRLKLS